jgi:hypothetical protein
MPLNGPDESNITQVRSFSFGHSTEDARLNKIGSFQVAAIYLIELNGSERHLIVRPHKRRIHIISQWEDFEMTNQEIARSYYEARIRGNSEEFWRDHVSDNIGYHLPPIRLSVENFEESQQFERQSRQSFDDQRTPSNLRFST